MISDTVIYNAEIIDGTGTKGYPADLAVKNGRIVKIGQLGHHAAASEIDAAGSVVTPGFIDSHSHADLVIFDRDGIIDHADYQNPRRPPSGISHILVEGVMAMNNGRLTGRKAGRLL